MTSSLTAEALLTGFLFRYAWNYCCQISRILSIAVSLFSFLKQQERPSQISIAALQPPKSYKNAWNTANLVAPPLKTQLNKPLCHILLSIFPFPPQSEKRHAFPDTLSHTGLLHDFYFFGQAILIVFQWIYLHKSHFS